VAQLARRVQALQEGLAQERQSRRDDIESVNQTVAELRSQVKDAADRIQQTLSSVRRASTARSARNSAPPAATSGPDSETAPETTGGGSLSLLSVLGVGALLLLCLGPVGYVVGRKMVKKETRSRVAALKKTMTKLHRENAAIRARLKKNAEPEER
jgi:cell division protein FtsB